jgi:predicted lipoprotein with Yx(FWY)xxD motif
MSMRNTRRLLTLAFVVIAGCGDDDNQTVDASPPPPPPPPDAAGPSIALSPGGYLVDSQGKTLYFFANDVPGSNTTCGGAGTGCLTTWPAFDVQSPTVGAGLTATDFARFDRGGGMFQTTWKGRPLYYYAMDTAAMPTAGDQVGGRWFTARAYNVFFGANATVTPLGSTTANAPFLTNGAGRTLYVFRNDTPGTATTQPMSACGPGTACVAVWPLWLKPATLTNVVLPSNIPAADVSSFDNGGMVQFTYKGWPLYFYATDDLPGEVAGASVSVNWKTVNTAWNGVFP